MSGRLAAAFVALAIVSASAAGSATMAFDSSRAFEHMRQLVAIGPRPSGSAGIQQAREYIEGQLKAIGLTPQERAFDAQTPFGVVRMANVIARIPGARPERILLTGHFDTKLYRQFRFVGANDGGSSAAMLLELARVLKGRKNAYTIEFVFFDGEEAVLPEWGGTDHTYGSRHYVEAAKHDGSIASIKAMILFDMIGDRNLTIRQETKSTPWLTAVVWDSAKRLGHHDAFLDDRFEVEDDHQPFLDAGLPAVDIIDLEYNAWHTANDTLDEVSARSLQAVGDVFLDALPRIEGKLSNSK